MLFLTQSFAPVTTQFFSGTSSHQDKSLVHFKISLYFSSMCVAFMVMVGLYRVRIKLMYFLYFFSILQLMYKNLKEMALNIHL